ncbi:MAG TPA: AI-2E family transporter, partial [Planctomycetota bacterium]
MPNRQFTALVAIVATVALGWLLHVGAGILQPLVIALLLAGMLQPVVVKLKHWHIPPLVTVVVLTLLLVGGIFRVGLLVSTQAVAFLPSRNGVEAPPVPGGAEGPVAEAEDGQDPTFDPLSESQAELARKAGGWDELRASLKGKLEQSTSLAPELVTWLKDTLDSVEPSDFIGNVAGNILGGGFGFASSLGLVVIYMLFIFAEASIFRRKILSVAGDRSEDADQVLDTIASRIQRYLGVKTVTSLATGALCYLGLVVIGVPYAILFGLLAFLLNYIPTFGSIIAGVAPSLVA